MRLFTLAIASIVDVSTGHGLAGSKHFIDPDTGRRRGLEIRPTSVHGVFAAIRSAIAGRIEVYRARVQERRDLRRLMAMNDRLLKDIGITRGDLMAVEMGATSLTELHAERQARRRGDDVGISSTVATTTLALSGTAANEQSYVEKKCA